MTEIPYWIQHADFSTDEFPPTNIASAIKAFGEHCWESELEMRMRREDVGEDFCDPGIGFVPGDGRILHICPMAKGRGYIHYHFPEDKRLLGLIPLHSQAVRSNMDIQVRDAHDFIRRFYDGDHDWLLLHTTV